MPVVGENIYETFAAHDLHRDAIGQAVALVGAGFAKIKPVEKALAALRDDAHNGCGENAPDGFPRFFSQGFFR